MTLRTVKPLVLLPILLVITLVACSEPEDDPPVDVDLEGDIIFSSNRTGAWELFIMDIDGTDLLQLTDNKFVGNFPAKFSPDGSRIFFAATDLNYQTDLYGIDRDGTDQISLTNGDKAVYNPHISPDGLYIGYANLDGRQQIEIINSDGTNGRMLASNVRHALAYGFTPDSNYLLCTGIDTSGTESALYLVPVNGSPAIVIGTYKEFGMKWPSLGTSRLSPDGSKIAFTISGYTYQDETYSNIYLVESDGTNLVQLSNNRLRTEISGFSIDGEQILYVEEEPTRNINDLKTINLDGTNERNITNSDLGERNGLFIDGNRIVYDAAQRVAGNWNYSIYMMDLNSGTSTRLTELEYNDRGLDVYMPTQSD